eukprot:gene6898-6740_t
MQVLPRNVLPPATFSADHAPRGGPDFMPPQHMGLNEVLNNIPGLDAEKQHQIRNAFAAASADLYDHAARLNDHLMRVVTSAITAQGAPQHRRALPPAGG